MLDHHQEIILVSGKYSQIHIVAMLDDDESSRKFDTLFLRNSSPPFSPFSAQSYQNGGKIGFGKRISVLLSRTLDRAGSLREISDRLENLGYPIFDKYYHIDVEDSPCMLKYHNPQARLAVPLPQIVFGKIRTFDFLTCHGVKRVKAGRSESLNILLDPLYPLVWIITIAISTLLVGFVTLVTKNSDMRVTRLSYKVEFVVRCVLENSPNPRTTEETSVTILFQTGFLMYCFFLVNLYKAVLVCDGTIADSVVTNVTNFTDIANFNVTTPSFETNFTTKATPSIINTPFGRNLVMLRNQVNVPIDLLELYKNMSELHSGRKKNVAFHPENREGFLKLISPCGNTAFVDKSARIGTYLNYFNREMGEIKFVKGEESLRGAQSGWIFTAYQNTQCGYVYRKLQAFVHSGIYNLYNDWHDGYKSVGGGIEKESGSGQG
ncbi:hypothetical protein Fcan01_10475 [Folsomia candida]|uniref:Uncharacterized protein n=1 Tax=Folsomia candida TaxID=158441 RepID=A0A226ECU3_FOLCA|nr:hypothetical protein Fcan01_10475 [Folsomia candida]